MQRRALQLIAACFFLIALIVSSCSNSSGTQGSQQPPQITLTVATNQVGNQAQVLKDIAQKFEKANPNIKVDFQAPGAEYENIMKVKMASKHMPDVFATHGWAQIRYGSFLADLRDQSWVSRLDPNIKSTVTDASGKVYILPLDQDKAGPVYNVDILQKYGVAVPTTFDELIAACQTIKTKSNGTVIPIHMGAADSWPMGQFFDFFATPLLISPSQNYQAQLKDGSFDWSKWTPLPQKLLELQQKGCLNKDVLTAKYSDSAAAFAQGKVAFGIYGPFLIDEAKKTNPSLNAGLMPIPSLVAGDPPTFAGGEKTTWGVWKDSPNLDAAKKFVAFYAQPENMAQVAEADRLPPGLTDVKANLGDLDPFFQKYSSTPIFPYFDRVFLPNGMWDVMCKNGQNLLAGSITPDQYSANMKQEFQRLKTTSS
jgi:raffinose/stachyose/melibiose transport system substrate-binding protein